MRSLLWCALAATATMTALALAGCGEAEDAAGAGIDVQLEAGRKAAESVGKSLMEREIRAFRDEHARFPESLDEVCEDRGMRVPALPLNGRWEYDPDTGTVSAVFGNGNGK